MIIIDASHLFFRNFWMSKNEIIEYRPDENGVSKPTGVVNVGYMTHVIYYSILNLTNKFKASEGNRVVIALDSKPSWRHDYYVEHSKQFPEYNENTYKGDRKKHDDLPFDQIWEAFNIGMDNLRENTDFKVVKVDKCEADDIVAVLSMNSNDEQVFVCSSDKDFHQLQTEKIHIYDPIKKIIIPPIDVERHKQIHHLCAGDDNIKAVKPRCGIKTAEKMIAEGLDDILKSNPEIRKRYEFNKTLIDFECIPKDLVQNIIEAEEKEEQYNYNATKLMSFFSKYRMKQILPRINQFKLKGKAYEKMNIGNQSTKSVANVAETSIEEFFS